MSKKEPLTVSPPSMMSSEFNLIKALLSAVALEDLTFDHPAVLVPIYSNPIMFAKDFSNKIFSG
jgi:hypothetical protein